MSGPSGAARDARARVQARLALASTIIWFVVTFGAAVLLNFGYGTRAPLVLLLGFTGLLVAALPWLAYRRLVARALREAEERDRQRRPGGDS